MKTFIATPSQKIYMSYAKTMQLNPFQTFHCLTKEEAIKSRDINNAQDIHSEAIEVSFDKEGNSFLWSIL